MYRLKHTLQQTNSHLIHEMGALVLLLKDSTQMGHSDILSSLGRGIGCGKVLSVLFFEL